MAMDMRVTRRAPFEGQPIMKGLGVVRRHNVRHNVRDGKLDTKGMNEADDVGIISDP